MSSIVMSLRRSRTTRTATDNAETEQIGPSAKDSMVVLVGREDALNGLQKFIVSRPHMNSLGPRWSEAVIRKRKAFKSNKVSLKALLPNDDAAAVRLVLYISHLQHDKLPQQLDFNELIRLAEVAERYDLNAILRPFVRPWLQPYRSRLLEPGYEQWLYLAWQFELEEDFLQLAQHLAKCCAVNAPGQLLIPGTDRLIEGSIPRDVLQTIIKSRKELLADVLGGTYQMMYAMVRQSSCLKPETSERERYTCTAKNILGLQRYLKLRELGSPVPKIDDIYISANEVIEMLTHPVLRMTMMRPILGSLHGLESPFAEGPLERHNMCLVETELAARIEQVVSGRRWAVSPAMFSQLRKNVGKTSSPSGNTDSGDFRLNL